MSADPSSFAAANRRTPICLIILGMAGTGKTTFTKKLHETLTAEKKKVYTVNLDPAVQLVPYPLNIDIRETVNYKKIMKQYQLGPNGAIMTSLNLYATKFDQVLDLLEKRAPSVDVFLIDTPGQIEVFTWSASGQLITEALSSSFPTTVVYLLDAVRCTRPVSFMSNMLYACSVLYKSCLPFLLTFNKCDVADSSTAIEWMRDADTFFDSTQTEGTYMSCLSRSSALVLEEFYRTLPVVSLSSATGKGFDDFIKAMNDAVEKFHKEFVPWKLETMKKNQQKKIDEMAENLQKLEIDMSGDPAMKKIVEDYDE